MPYTALGPVVTIPCTFNALEAACDLELTEM